MIVGDLNKLKVKRIGDISYILEDGDEELFLHKKEALKEHQVGDEVTVFIYKDSKGRICASENKPLISINHPAFLKVVEVKEGVGYFLDDGMPKDLLLNSDDCIFEDSEKPIIGDYLFVYLKVTGGTFRARLVSKTMYPEYFKPTGELEINEYYKAYITSRGNGGVTAYTPTGYEIFIPRGNDRSMHRIGECVIAQIVRKIDNLHYHGSLLKRKTLQLDEDSKKVYNFLKSNKNTIVSEDMSPIEIYNLFQLSKASFKRAVGKLYKERLIELYGSNIKLKVE